MVAGGHVAECGYRPATLGHVVVSLSEYWDGSDWVMTPVINPAGSSSISDVSCTSADACTAVGRFGTDGVSPLVERWHGTNWSVQIVPSQGEVERAALWGVSCPTSANCTAVGDYVPRSARAASTLIEQWSGKSWEVEPSPNQQWPTMATVVHC